MRPFARVFDPLNTSPPPPHPFLQSSITKSVEYHLSKMTTTDWFQLHTLQTTRERLPPPSSPRAHMSEWSTLPVIYHTQWCTKSECHSCSPFGRDDLMTWWECNPLMWWSIAVWLRSRWKLLVPSPSPLFSFDWLSNGELFALATCDSSFNAAKSTVIIIPMYCDQPTINVYYHVMFSTKNRGTYFISTSSSNRYILRKLLFHVIPQHKCHFSCHTPSQA